MTTAFVVRSLDGVFSGSGFVNKSGRRPTIDDCGFIAGPIDIAVQDDGLIHSIGKNLAAPSIREIDGRGLFATHSFADTHTHSLFAGTRAREYFLRWQGQSYQDIAKAGGGILNTQTDTSQCGDSELLSRLSNNLKLRRQEGVTHVEIKTGYGLNADQELRLLRLLTKAKDLSYDVKIFRTFLGLHAVPKGVEQSAFVNSMIAVLPQIKSEGLCDFVDAFPDTGFFSLQESLRFTDAAAKLNLDCRIHADELSDLGTSKAYADRGALSVDHLQNISEAGIDALAKSNTVATLLPATSFFLNIDYANARSLIDKGCAVSLASDFNPGTAPEHSILFTARLAASQLKMSAPEILCALTHNAFASLKISGSKIAPKSPAALAFWPTRSSRFDENLESLFIEATKPVASALGSSLLFS